MNKELFARLLESRDAVHEVADTPTPPAMQGTWTLVAPDGHKWEGTSPLDCVASEMRARVPALVGLARMFREVLDTPVDDEGEDEEEA